MEKNLDLERIQDPDNWPYWPVLPMKNKGAVGLLFDYGNVFRPDIRPEIRLCNLWSNPEVMRNAQVLKFDSLEALIAAGWVVD